MHHFGFSDMVHKWGSCDPYDPPLVSTTDKNNLIYSYILHSYTYYVYIWLLYILQDLTSRNLNSELTDECGEVNTVSKHVIMMIPFYYIPLLLLLIVLVVKLSVKFKIR